MDTKRYFTEVSWYANFLEPVQPEIHKKDKPDVQQDVSVKERDRFFETDAWWPELPDQGYRRERKRSQQEFKRKNYR